jgi:hypothetical protein
LLITTQVDEVDDAAFDSVKLVAGATRMLPPLRALVICEPNARRFAE